MSEEKKIRMVPAVCTQCGAKLDVDPGQEAAVCPYCGTPFLVEKAINNYHIQYSHTDVHNNIRIQNGKRGVVESALDFINTQTRQQNEYQLEQQRLAFEKEKYANERKSARNRSILRYLGWFFGFVYIFPVPVMMILKKKTDMDEGLKKKIIIGCWAIYLLIFASGVLFRRDTPEESKAPQPAPVYTQAPVAVSDFNPASNKAVVISGYTVQIPSTWKMQEGKALNEGGQIEYLEPSGGGSAFDNMWNDPEGFLNSFTEQYTGISDRHTDTIQRGKMRDVCFSFRGMPQNRKREEEIFLHFLKHDESNTAIILVLFQFADQEKDYESDFNRIVNAVTWQKPEASPQTAGGIRPEFREQMDAYEAFMDEYIAFMKSYDASDTSASYLNRYMDLLSKYGEFTEKIDQIDESELSEEEDRYFLEVTMRVEKKLYDALGKTE